MIFYLAGSFSRRPELIHYAKRLQDHGHEVTSRWLFTDHEVKNVDDPNSLKPESDAFRFAIEDLEDIDKATGFIHFTGPSSKRFRGGRHVEQGWAMKGGRMCIIIGPRENAFHSLINDEMIWPDFDSFLKSPFFAFIDDVFARL